MVSDGLNAGAFRLVSASRLLEGYVGKDHAAATALFSEMSAAFPSNSGFAADIVYLLDQAKQIAVVNRDLATQAIDIALRAATSDVIQQQPPAVRESLFRNAAKLLQSIDPALLKRYLNNYKDLGLPAAKSEATAQEEKSTKLPDVTSMSYSAALTEARAIDSPTDRIEKLIELSRREDLTSEQRTSVASEALSLTGELPISGDRMTGLAMLARDFARRNDLANAALAAQMLANTYAKACDCGGAKCSWTGEEIDCLGSVEEFCRVS